MARAGESATALNRRTIAIAGGGIAGLTAALALQKLGYRALVLEQRPQPAIEGAGIQISPNAFHVLTELDLGRALISAGSMTPSVTLHDGLSGEQLNSFDLGETSLERYGAPYCVLHRADLLEILTTACAASPEIEIRYGESVNDAAQHARGVTVLVGKDNHFQEITARALVGADGVNSAARNLVPGAQKPAFDGHIAWRGMVAMDDVPEQLQTNTTNVWLGPAAHIVHYPVRQASIMNVVAILPWRSGKPPNRWIANVGAEERARPFAAWHPALKQLIGRQSSWGGWPIHAVKSVGSMNMGNICLIGDAAHAMLPYAAQGGACAIEDAGFLAAMLTRADNDIPVAFQEFSRHRRRRISRILKLARANQMIYHASGPFRTARNLALKFAPQNAMQRRMDWLYSHRI